MPLFSHTGIPLGVHKKNKNKTDKQTNKLSYFAIKKAPWLYPRGVLWISHDWDYRRTFFEDIEYMVVKIISVFWTAVYFF